MKKLSKLSSIFLAIIMSLYGVAIATPTLASADDGSGHVGNHGSQVSAVARSHSEDSEGNHGSVVSSVAKNNNGQNNNGVKTESGDDQNENENENEGGGGNGNGGGTQNGAFQITGISAVPSDVSSVISWTTGVPTSGTVLFGTSFGSLTGSASEASSSPSLSHQVTLTGLTPSTAYFYAVSAKDASLNVVQSNTLVFKTTAGPVVTGNIATEAATGITSSDAVLNGMNGSTAATDHSFWVSLSPIDTSSPNIPAGVYSTPDLGAIAANTAFSASLSSLTTSGVPGNLPAITPNTAYYFVAWSMVGGTWYPGSVMNFTTASTTPADTTNPDILFATKIGSSASSTSLIWVTDEPSNSNLWIGTTSPVATTTAPVATSGTLSYFHMLSIPNLATSTLYYYTVSSADASGNTAYYSNSFTTPSN